MIPLLPHMFGGFPYARTAPGPMVPHIFDPEALRYRQPLPGPTPGGVLGQSEAEKQIAVQPPPLPTPPIPTVNGAFDPSAPENTRNLLADRINPFATAPKVEDEAPDYLRNLNGGL